MTDMTFDAFVRNAQTIFDHFPNEQIWQQGGLKPNRQLQQPEAGYCVVIRYDEKTVHAIAHFVTEIRSVLPPIVEYNEQNFHTTIGTYEKRDMEGFIPDLATLQRLERSVEKGIHDHSRNLCIRFGRWLYNSETIIVPGYPDQDFWRLFQNIGNACQEDGHPLEMGRIIHITTARFISCTSFQDSEQFRVLMKSAPAIEPSKPGAIDLATWRCDGRRFDLVTHKRYRL
ncbi:MAG: hypothetical protein ACOYYS_12655 [Chloroflexota bacterium]